MNKSFIKAPTRLRELFRQRRLETGFSMLEAVVVVGVLLALAVGGFFAYGPITENAKKAKVKSAASEVHTAVLVASIDGDASTEPQGVIDNWNKSTDKIRVAIVPPTAGGTSANGDFCVSATNVESPSITARTGACDAVTGGGNTDPNDKDGDGIPNNVDPDIDGDTIPNASDPDIDGDGVPNGTDTTPNGEFSGGGNVGGDWTPPLAVPGSATVSPDRAINTSTEHGFSGYGKVLNPAVYTPWQNHDVDQDDDYWTPDYMYGSPKENLKITLSYYDPATNAYVDFYTRSADASSLDAKAERAGTNFFAYFKQENPGYTNTLAYCAENIYGVTQQEALDNDYCNADSTMTGAEAANFQKMIDNGGTMTYKNRAFDPATMTPVIVIFSPTTDVSGIDLDPTWPVGSALDARVANHRANDSADPASSITWTSSMPNWDLFRTTDDNGGILGENGVTESTWTINNATLQYDRSINEGGATNYGTLMNSSQAKITANTSGWMTIEFLNNTSTIPFDDVQYYFMGNSQSTFMEFDKNGYHWTLGTWNTY